MERKSVAKRIIASTRLNATVVPKSEPEEAEPEIDLSEEMESNELSGILEVLGMDDATGIIARVPKRENEDAESFHELPEYSDDLPSRGAIVRFDREDGDRMEETEEKPRFRRLVITCRYCGRLYSFRTDQPQPPTCGMAQCIAKFEEGSKEKLVAK